MGKDKSYGMKMYRQEKLVEKLLKFRLKGYGFSMIKVEVYDRFDGDKYMCRVECFKGGKRVLKHEATLTPDFVRDVEGRLEAVIDK